MLKRGVPKVLPERLKRLVALKEEMITNYLNTHQFKRHDHYFGSLCSCLSRAADFTMFLNERTSSVPLAVDELDRQKRDNPPVPLERVPSSETEFAIL